jgi:hypothetical protein
VSAPAGQRANAALREPARDEPESDAVVTQQFESRAAPIAKDKQSAGERVFRQRPLAQRGQAINAVAEIDGLAGEQNPQLWDQLNHGA